MIQMNGGWSTSDVVQIVAKTNMNLRQLFGLCEHVWETIGVADRVDEFGDVIGENFKLKCKKCGNIKKVRA